MTRIELFGRQQAADPYPFYARLREDHPVCPVALPNGVEMWFVTRYEDANKALSHPALTKDPSTVRDMLNAAGSTFFSEEYDRFNAHMLNADPPEHTRLRRPVSKCFTPRRVQEMRPQIESLADELLDKMADRSECDLLESYARPLPLPLICALMGVPAQDADQVLKWSRALFAPPEGTPALTARQAAAELGDYLTALVERRMSGTDGGNSDDDLIGQLVQSPSLSHQELLSTVMLVLLTGHTSTSDLIGNAVLALLRNPDQLQSFRSGPDSVDVAVDELLRYDTSVFRATMRIATDDVELGGTVIPRGSMVGVVVGAANRDPARFPDPDRLDLARGDRAHLSLGQGVHYCLGAALARTVIGVALIRLFTRFPGLQLAVPVERLSWVDPGSGVGRCLESLPVLLGPG